jgi:hypothetical protein
MVMERYPMLPAIGFGIIVLLILVATVVLERPLARRRLAAFNERFPPISDDEFMARCPAEANRVVALKVRRIVADQLGIEYARIYPESSFVNDLGA